MKSMECSKNQLGMKRMKKGVKRSENRFDSKDDYTSTKVSGLKTSKLENVYFSTVVDLFDIFLLIIYLPNSNIEERSYGKNTKTVHRGAKNPIFGAVVGIFPVAVRIWVETPHCDKKNLSAALTRGKQCIECLINLEMRDKKENLKGENSTLLGGSRFGEQLTFGELFLREKARIQA